jgi:hypothetical protein
MYPTDKSCPNYKNLPSANDDDFDQSDDDDNDCEAWLALLKAQYLQILAKQATAGAADFEILKRQYSKSVGMFCQFCPKDCAKAPRFP